MIRMPWWGKTCRWWVFVGMGWVLALGCATPSTPGPEVTGGENILASQGSLTQVQVIPSGEGTQIQVQADIPLTYTTYLLEAPLRWVVDLPGVRRGDLPETIPVSQGPVIRVRLQEIQEPTQMVRMEVELSREVETRAQPKEGGLLLWVGKTGTQEASGPPLAPMVEVQPPEPLPEDEATLAQMTQKPPSPSAAASPGKKPREAVSLVPQETKQASSSVSLPAPSQVESKSLPSSQGTTTPAPHKESSTVPPKSLSSVQKPSPSSQIKTAPKPAAAREKPRPPRPRKPPVPRISLDFEDADITHVLRILAEVSGRNMVIGEGVQGTVTVRMRDVPWDQALDVLLQMKGLGKLEEGNILWIDTQEALARRQEALARAREAQMQAKPLHTRVFAINYARAADLQASLKRVLSPRGELMVDERTNTLIVKDVDEPLQEVTRLVEILDQPTRQVLIEARIVQADTNFARDLGVQWGGFFNSPIGTTGTISVVGGNLGEATQPTTGFAVDLPAQGEAGTLGALGITLGRLTTSPLVLDLRLSAGEAMGLTKIISTPKITTLDNREARIEQGQSIPYQTTSLQFGTRIEFVDATLTLKVTPKITPDRHVYLKIVITKNRPGTPAPGAPPPIDKKEVHTEVLVRDGETTVIGGIFETTETSQTLGVPWFQKIPFLGHLFRQDSRANRKSELLIFITPHILSPET